MLGWPSRGQVSQDWSWKIMELHHRTPWNELLTPRLSIPACRKAGKVSGKLGKAERRERETERERRGRERKEEGEKKSKKEPPGVGAVQEGLPGVLPRLTAAYVYEGTWWVWLRRDTFRAVSTGGREGETEGRMRILEGS